ncbi:MAG: c-type cytochrome, partial [Pseudomonadota bacterium]
MSKSLNTIIVPALGGTALMLGLAYGLASRDYGGDRIDVLETRLAQLDAHASKAALIAKESEAIAATANERASQLETQVALVQAEAKKKATSVGNSLTEPAPIAATTYGLGRPAHDEEIEAWDVDVLPNGQGLPEGKGDVGTGEQVFADSCASCHGDFAEGVDNWPVLAGGFDTLANEDPVKTVGSYWPHLSTVWDYVHRSMPFGYAGTLSADDTY